MIMNTLNILEPMIDIFFLLFTYFAFLILILNAAQVSKANHPPPQKNALFTTVQSVPKHI